MHKPPGLRREICSIQTHRPCLSLCPCFNAARFLGSYFRGYSPFSAHNLSTIFAKIPVINKRFGMDIVKWSPILTLAGRTAAAFLFPPLVSWPRIIKRHSYGVPERFVDNAGSWLAGNYLSVQYLLFPDPRFER